MNQLHSRTDIKKLGTILSVWAHPDDETLACAGIMAQAIKNGQKVACITATRGEAGSQDLNKWPAENLGKIRTQELMAALSIIGVKDHHWLDYRDGTCQDQDNVKAASTIAMYIQKFRPDTILTFGSDGLTGHPDHRAVSNWVTEAIDTVPQKPTVYHAVIAKEQYENYLKEADVKLNIFYNIDEPPLVIMSQCDLMFTCDQAEMCALKRAAIAAMPSQTEILFRTFSEDFIDRAFMYEAFVKAT